MGDIRKGFLWEGLLPLKIVGGGGGRGEDSAMIWSRILRLLLEFQDAKLGKLTNFSRLPIPGFLINRAATGRGIFFY